MIRNLLKNELSNNQKDYIGFNKETTQGLLKQLEHAIVNNDNGIGLPYWSAKDPKMVKDFTFAMVKLGYGTVIASRKYSRFEFNMDRLDSKLLEEFRVTRKLRKFLLREDTTPRPSNLVRSVGKTAETGIDRKGFARTAKCPFKYDIDMLQRYYEPIKLTLLKSLRIAKDRKKLTDKYFADVVNYDELVTYCLNHYMLDNTYNLESNISDTRGRSIYNALKRVGNPISSKDFRSLLVAPPVLVTKNSTDKLNDIYYFITELLGSKATTEEAKIIDGEEFYKLRELPVLDLTLDNDRKYLHELIWLERIYTKLDSLFLGNNFAIQWDIPLEVDASMSIGQFVGALTNDNRLLTRTNVLGHTLTDPWHIDGVRRLAAKAVGTPTFYGSSQSAISLIKSKGLSTDKNEIIAIRKEFATGGLAIMKQFKDAIIKNYSMNTPNIHMKIWNDTFTVEVNKFKAAGSKVIVTEAYDGKAFKHTFTHQPTLVPDYEHMKLYWATCLIHNLDSQVMDSIAYESTKWMLTIHDAGIVLPGTAKEVRKAYAIKLKEINTNRYSILQDFRESIGATSLKADIAFMKLHKAVEQAEDLPFSQSAMK